MASQQPSQARPWFRLASIRAIPPPSAPSSTPQPDRVPPPRPVIRPAFSQTFRAPPPPPQEPTPPPPPPPDTVTPPPPPPTTPTRSSPPLARVSPTPPPPRASPPPITPTTTTTSSMPTSPVIRALAPTSTMTTSPPTLSSSSVPQLPKPKVSSPSSSLPTSPPLKQPINGPLLSSTSPKLASPFPPQVPATITAHSPNPSSSPKTITSLAHSPSSSPKIRNISHPPSPLTLPPAQLRSDTTQSRPKITQEPEQKNVLVQQTIEKSKLTNTNSNSSHKYVDGTRSPPVKGNHQVTKDKGKYKKSSDSDDYVMRIITIAGDNKGAIMELNPWRNKYNLKKSPQVWSDGENSGKEKYDEKAASSYVNSNVQGINNSIMFNASCTHNDPGVHLSLSRNGNGHRGIHMKDRVIKD